MLVFIYHVGSKKSPFRQPPVVDIETGSLGGIDPDNRSDRTLRNPKKKMPKMWDVRIPKHGHPAPSRYDQDDEDDDDIEEKDAGKWDTIKPMSVAYIKNTQHQRTSAPPGSHQSIVSGPRTEPTTPTTPSFCNFSAQQLETSGRRMTYDKATIEAVQVSVLISMPTKPGAAKAKALTAGPLELGIAKIALDDDKKWKRRTGRPVAHDFAV